MSEDEMANITNTTQLDLFTIHRTILLANSTLSKKFKSKDFYEYDPKNKSSDTSFPYFIIRLPDTDDEKVDLKNKDVLKTFTQEIVLRMDYEARDKARTYANAVLYAIGNNQSTYNSSGYSEVSITLESSVPVLLDSKYLIETTFSFSCEGVVRK